MLTFPEVKNNSYLNCITIVPHSGEQKQYVYKYRKIAELTGTGSMENTIPNQNIQICIKSPEKMLAVLSSLSKKIGLLSFVLTLAFATTSLGQTTFSGTGNWSAPARWSAGIPGAGTAAIIANGAVCTIDMAAVCSSLTISGGGNLTSVTINGANSLTVSGAVIINAGTGGGDNRIIAVGSGTFTCASITMNVTGNENRNSQVSLSTGTVTVSGNVTMNDADPNRNFIRFTGTGTLFVGGNLSGGTISSAATGGTAPTSGTVNYNSSGAQQVGSYTYYNLTVSGGNIKTIQGNVTVNSILNLSNGNLSLGSGANNLTIGINGSITGAFDNTHMIVCDGTGSLIKQSTIAAGLAIVYPVGTNGYFSPLEITSLTATVAGTGSINVRAISGTAPGPPAANATDLQKYWVVTTPNLSAITADASFTYVDPNEVGTGGDQTTYQPFLYSGGAWSLGTAASSGGTNPMTVNGTNSLAGTWTGREGPLTYYSYQSGNWNVATTWTTDPSGTLSVNPNVPGALDRVVILNGRTVTTTASHAALSTQINEGGFLDIGTTTGHNFGTVSGQGRLRLQTNTFPGGTYTNFIATGGGTVEYYSTANFDFSQLVYNNLILNLSNGGIVATLMGNMTINGDLTVTTGRFQINNNAGAARTVTIEGDVTVAADGYIQLGTGNFNHTFTVRGDFTNEGSVDFYEGTAADYTGTIYGTTAHADVEFDNDFADQNLICNGYSEFYRIGINKGTDWTYALNVDADNSSNFLLYGCNNNAHTNDGDVNLKALGLTAGTLKLGSNIIIPSLTSDIACNYLNYDINSIAQLIIDGADVSSAATPLDMALVIYGKLVLNGGSFDASNTRSSVITRTASTLIINGGTFTATQLRTSNEAGTHRGAFIMTGGTLNLTTNPVDLCWADNSRRHATLSFTYPDNVFQMSGGVINILGSTPQIDEGAGTSGFNFSLVLGSNPENISVTGGTINITIPTTRPAYITSTAPFWNLNVIGTNGTYSFGIRDFNATSGTPASVTAKPLVVYNNYNIQSLGIFDNATNTQDVTVGGNFVINSGTSYIPANNTTTLNGLAGQVFDNTGTIGSSGLYNFVVTNSSNTNISQNLTIRNNLTINSGCFLQDMGRTISVAGNIINSGTHISQAGGGVLLNGGGAQIIDGSGSGIFGNLILNKSAGTTSLIANQGLTGNLRLASGLLDIGIYNLSLSAASNVYDALYPATTAVFFGTKMIRTSGNQSDGGITKAYNSTNAFVFPIGTASDYTPSTIQFTSAPATWGSVNVKPVAQYQPFTAITPNSLNYYWKVTSSGITGIPAGSISHTYRYVTSDLRGTEGNYIPAVYNPYGWTIINNPGAVLDASNDILFTNVDYLDGDFTAGEPAAFTTVKVFYSRNSSDWNDPITWSSVAVGGPMDGAIPGANNPVVIGDGVGINHFVTISSGTVTVGGLQINDGSTLDITTTTGHNFGAIPDTKVSGTGTLRISSAIATATFPGGDFGNFLADNGGTVEYYTTGTNFTLPAISTYNNLILSAATGQTITMPDLDMMVFNDYTVSGTGTGVAQLNSAAARTLTISNNINITGGILRFMNNTFAQTLYANNDISISSGATFDVSTATNATNILYITGNLDNDGIFDMYGGAAARVCNVYFIGNTDKVISGTGGTNEFNYLNVNKGTSRNTILDVTANNLSLSGSGAALILNNGTFRVSNSALNFILSTTTSFSIPISAALSVNQGTVTIGTTNNAGDLSLAGRLEVINNGVVNIGDATPNINNDIEYASGGDPEIIVTGSAVLNVDGQIRRGLTIPSGSLNYSQSGGTVTISGHNANATRAKFELLNSGSTFNMSGGTLIIVNGGGTTFGDVLITPESYNVTGGTIQFGTGATATTTFALNANSPLWNVTVDATTNTKTVDLRVNTLDLQNDLSINGNSVFRTNGLNVNIAGSMINNNINAAVGLTNGGYQAGTLTQITTFNGSGAQTIQGTGANLTNFANLIIMPSGSVSLASNSNLQVNSNLSLLSGTISDGSNTITVLGNIVNNATHNSPTAIGGIILAGPAKQIISGSGTGIFGNVNLDNSLGIDMVDNSVINGHLTFSNGNLYIDDYMLTFGVNATIGGIPNANKMILMNGVISDQGVKKLYPASAADFTFPIGVAGKYTPVRYNVTANGAAGSILIRPVNYKHPATYENPAATNELQYYWYAVSSGFSGLTADHEYHYIDADALPDETDYVVGRYIPATYTWSSPAEGTVYSASDYFTISGVGYIDGEYTCGVNIAPSPNFQDMPIYYSRNATLGGNWTDPNAWTLNADGTGGPAPSYPQGNAVVIRATDHTITINANSQTAYSVEVIGTLAVGTTLYHSLGHIRGGGTINLTSTASGSFVFPAGVYDEFLANASSTIDFYNNSAVAATLPLKPGNDYKPYQNVIFSGLGIKYMSAENMRALGNLTNNTGTLNNTLHNKNITLLGNWTDNNTAATGGFVPGTGRVILNGTVAKLITITGGSTVEQFYNLQINNAAGATITGGGQVSVSKYLYLTLGNITTTSTNLLSLTNTSTSAVIGGGSTSFVNGPLRKSISSGSYFNFPIGNNSGTRYGNLYVSGVSAAGNYLAQYYNHNPGDDGYDPAIVVNPIDAVSNVEYWRLNGPAATANVRVRWDSQSGIIPVDAASRQKLRIVEWNSSAWENRGNVIVDGGVNSGTIQTNPAVTVTGDHRFTIGVESLPTATITSGAASICDDGSTTNISIDLTGTSPWTIRYEVDGSNETEIENIGSSPYPLVVSNAIEPLLSQGPDDYVFNVSYVQDATGSTGIRDFTTTVTITLNESPNPVISGNTTVSIGETGVLYQSGTGNIPGHTYVWTVSPGATITAGQGTYQIAVSWPGSFGSGWVRLQETVTIGGCSVTTSDYVVSITDVPSPSVSGPDPVCLNEIYTYRTPLVGGHSYVWTLPLGGGSIIGVTNLDSVVVNWTSTGNYTVEVAETGSSTVTNALPVTVNPIPANTNIVTDPSICNGLSASIGVQGTAPGISYQLRLNSDNTNVGSPVSSGPGGDITLSASPTVTTIYNVYATNEYVCSIELTDLSTVTVTDPPTASAGSDESICAGSTFDLGTSVTPPSAAEYSSLAWSTSGDGSFDFPATLQPEYTPGSSDLSAGSAVLTLTTNGNGACSPVTDDMSLVLTAVPTITNPGDQTVCDSYTLPTIIGTNLTGNEAYYTGAGGTGTQYNATDVISVTTTLYIYDETGTTPNCSDEESFTITVNVTPVVNDITNQTVCDSYTLPAITGTNLTGNEAYYTGAGGTGTQYNATDVISVTTTLYIYDETGTTPNCSDEENFTITVNLTPNITDPGDQSACDSYTLPAIAGTNLTGNEAYWTGSGGTGTQYNAGDAIAATTTLYIYDETGTAPNCSDEESFAITINTSPSPSIIGSGIACETESEIYNTSATGNTFLWTITGGTIDSGQGTEEVTVIWDALPVGDVSASETVQVQETTAAPCQATDVLNVTIYHVPDTGPQHHIINNYTP